MELDLGELQGVPVLKYGHLKVALDPGRSLFWGEDSPIAISGGAAELALTIL